ncbi:MAG: hypothetical protein LQ340_002810 [Diploschistes diacapsis]|nr:MAG: hypothetical protein LQ340_002810 [Diploschistes diacapsis]
MSFSSIRFSCSLLFALLLSAFTSAHLVITYPGWRGDNLITNGTVDETNGLAVQNGLHPYGMQWEYPCGGMTTSTNRTNWPLQGGAVAFQPGWFQGHLLSTLYINMGNGTVPTNMSEIMVPAIAIQGPTNNPYPGLGVCFPQVPLPASYQPNIGDNATIQVIMLAQHGAALYSCVDITFAEPSEVAEVNKSNCQNSSQITFQTIFQSSSLTAGADSTISRAGHLVWLSLVITLTWSLLA